MNRSRRYIPVICLSAGLFYNSWPLGYWLNSPTTHHGLASDLELVGNPHYQVFIICDVLTAVCAAAVAVLIFWQRGQRLSRQNFIGFGLLVFGVFTAVSALLPSQCTITPVLRCGVGRGTGLGLDAVTSGLASVGLIISLLSLIIHRAKIDRLRLATLVGAAAWSLSGLYFSYLALTNHNAHFMQDIFLVMSGVVLLLIGLNLQRLSSRIYV